MTHLKINNKIDSPRWKSIPCTCKHDKDHIELDYPFKECLHCRYEICENSCPTESFSVTDQILDKDNKPTGETKQREIKEITLVYGRHDDLMGWTF